MRPAVVALIGSAGFSILLLALFDSGLSGIQAENLKIVELVLFAGGLFLLRRFREKVGAIQIIFGSGVVGTAAYLIGGLFL